VFKEAEHVSKNTRRKHLHKKTSNSKKKKKLTIGFFVGVTEDSEQMHMIFQPREKNRNFLFFIYLKSLFF